jgi:hypothetical protein
MIGVVVSAVVALLVAAPAASACSLAYEPPRERVDRADAAVYAEVVEATEVDRNDRGWATYRYRLRVLETYKGAVAQEIEIEGNEEESVCELGRLEVGSRHGLLLDGPGEPWRLSLSDRISRDELIQATARYPPPSGSGSAALLVAGPFGSADVVALDGGGRVLAYGFGAGAPQSVCPGSARFVARRAVVRLRDLSPVVRRRSPGRTSARCLDPLGRRVAGFTSWAAGKGRSRLVLAVGGRRRTLAAGRASEAVLGRRSAFLLTRGRVVRVRYATGRRRFVARLPRPSRRLAVSPGGRRLAVVAGSRLVVADRQTGRGLTRTIGPAGDLVWLAGDRLFVGGGAAGDARVFDASLNLVGSTPGWSSRDAVLGAGALWSIDAEGRVLLAQPSGTGPRPVSALPPSTRGPLLGVPGAPQVRASQRTPA